MSRFSAKKTFVPLFSAILIFGFIFYLIKTNSAPKEDSSAMSNVNDVGSLVANTNKPHYMIGEVVWVEIFSMVVGESITCSDDIQVKVFGPDGDKEYSSKAGSVQSLGICGKTSSDPTHRLRFTPEVDGEYIIRINDLSSGLNYESIITVGEEGQFIVERSGAGSVVASPGTRYHMTLKIKANQDFKGQVIDIVPQPFKLVWMGGAIVEGDEIYWDVDINKGESTELIYEFSIPESAPGIFTLGKAYLMESGKKVYEENQKWNVLVGVANE